MKRTRKYKRKWLSKRRTRYRKHKRKHKRKYKRKITRKKRRKCRKKTRRQKYSRKYQKHGGCGGKKSPRPNFNETYATDKEKNYEMFKTYLISCGVAAEDIDLWKPPKNKTLEDLWNEIKNQDIELKKTDGKLERIIHVARAKIFHTAARSYYLKEVKQTKKGKSKSRNVMLSEKMKQEERIKGENGVRDAIKRGIKEELGEKYVKNIRDIKVKGNINLLTAVTTTSREDSNSYPGLQAKYIYNTIEMIIPNLSNNHPINQEFETTDKSDGKIITWRWWPTTDDPPGK